MQIRIGLNSGDVVVRSIGSDLRMDMGFWLEQAEAALGAPHGKSP